MKKAIRFLIILLIALFFHSAAIAAVNFGYIVNPPANENLVFYYYINSDNYIRYWNSESEASLYYYCYDCENTPGYWTANTEFIAVHDVSTAAQGEFNARFYNTGLGTAGNIIYNYNGLGSNWMFDLPLVQAYTSAPIFTPEQNVGESITLNWQADGGLSYKLYRKLDNNDDDDDDDDDFFEKIYDGSGSSHQDNGLTPGDTYTYLLFAYAGNNVSVPVEKTVLAKVNQIPVAESQALDVAEDAFVAIALEACDSNLDPLTYHIEELPEHGSFTAGVNSDTKVITNKDNVVYTPEPDFDQVDSFTFYVNDGTVDSEPATVTITVNPTENDVPQAFNKTLSTDENVGNGLGVGGQSVTLNINLADEDYVYEPDTGDILVYELSQDVTKGTLDFNAGSGICEYVPDLHAYGEDSFIFRVKDTSGAPSAFATVTINIELDNEPPQAKADPVNITEDTSAYIQLQHIDPDTEDVITYTIGQVPDHGSLKEVIPGVPVEEYTLIEQYPHEVINAEKQVYYTPVENWDSVDDFSFTVSDQHEQDTAQIDITFTPENDAPVPNDIVE